jgi:hypothetical protein
MACSGLGSSIKEMEIFLVIWYLRGIYRINTVYIAPTKSRATGVWAGPITPLFDSFHLSQPKPCDYMDTRGI